MTTPDQTARDVIAAFIPHLPNELSRRVLAELDTHGYAIVKRPDRRGGIALAYRDSTGEVWGPWTADQARALAAVLLAAADHQEKNR